MGSSLGSLEESYIPSTTVVPGPELGFLSGLGRFISEDKGSAPSFLIKADYSRTVNIAVAGNSGVGKSLLVNTIRGVKPDDPTWAPVGVTETTQEPVWYEFPGETSVRLWDMEGAGGTCSWDDYTGSVGLRYFDVVLVLCSTRLTDSDVTIVQELEKQSIPFFFVRTKLDEDIRNNKADCGRSAEETEESIRCELQMGGITSPYLINARQPDKHDFPKLLKDIVIRLEIFERKCADIKAKAPLPEVEIQPEATPEVVAPKAAAAPEATAAALERTAPEAPEKTAEQAPIAAAGKPQTPDDKTGSPEVTASSPETDPLIFSLPQGIEPIEALCGRWVWFEDEGWAEYKEAELGVGGAAIMTAIDGHIIEQVYNLRPDGKWESTAKIKATAFFSKSSVVDVIDPNNKAGPLKYVPLGHKTYFCRNRSYVWGGRLVTEFKGSFESSTDGVKRPFCSRIHRFVVDDVFWTVMECLTEDRVAYRRFKRYPFYRIVNETNKELTVKTYSSAAVFGGPNTTATAAPGTTCIECCAPDVTLEQLVFTLPSRAVYKIPQAEPGGTYRIRLEHFA